MARLAMVRKRREEAESRKAEELASGGLSAKERVESAVQNQAAAGPQKLNPLEVA